MGIYVTTKLVTRIKDININEKGYKCAIKFFQIYSCFLGKDSENMFADIASKFLKREFSNNYKKLFLDKLLLNKIVVRNSYITEKLNYNSSLKPKPFGYKFDLDLLDYSDMEFIEIKQKTKFNQTEDNIDYVIEDLKKLEFDFDLMCKTINKIEINDFITLNENITNKKPITIENKFLKLKYKITVNKAITKAKDLGKELIEYKGEYFIEGIENFKKNKQLSIKTHNLHVINKIINKDFYAKRNSTNNRLDTSLTNLSDIFSFLNFIKQSYEKFKFLKLNKNKNLLTLKIFHYI